MVDLLPVRAYHPAEQSAASLISPVYDTLSDTDFRRFSKDPNNASTFVARPTSMGLAEFLSTAPGRVQASLRARAYVQDEEEALYVYGIRYVPPADVQEAIPPESRRPGYLLLGLVGSLDLAHTPESMIAPHESTFADRVAERVQLTEATGMTFAPILAGYTLPNHAINNLLEKTLGMDRRSMFHEGTVEPIVRVTLDGTEHRLWRLEDHRVRTNLLRLVAPLRILILDGHHRYAAARELLRRGRPGSSPLVMLVESRDRALRLLPWHRALPSTVVSVPELVRQAGTRFPTIASLGSPSSVEPVLVELARMARDHERGFVAVGPRDVSRFSGPASADGGADFDLLHGFLEQTFHCDPHDFGFFRSPRQALEAVWNPGTPWSGGVALLLPALQQEAIEERAFSTGRPMAQKSTMFLPKVAEGVLFSPARPLNPKQGEGHPSDRGGLSPEPVTDS